MPSGTLGGMAGKPRQDREVAAVFGPCLSRCSPKVFFLCSVSSATSTSAGVAVYTLNSGHQIYHKEGNQHGNKAK